MLTPEWIMVIKNAYAYIYIYIYMIRMFTVILEKVDMEVEFIYSTRILSDYI